MVVCLTLELVVGLERLGKVVVPSFAGKRELGFKRGLTYANIMLFANMV
jgi:hypothetical protein